MSNDTPTKFSSLSPAVRAILRRRSTTRWQDCLPDECVVCGNSLHGEGCERRYCDPDNTADATYEREAKEDWEIYVEDARREAGEPPTKDISEIRFGTHHARGTRVVSGGRVCGTYVGPEPPGHIDICWDGSSFNADR